MLGFHAANSRTCLGFVRCYPFAALGKKSNRIDRHSDRNGLSAILTFNVDNRVNAPVTQLSDLLIDRLNVPNSDGLEPLENVFVVFVIIDGPNHIS